MNSSKLTLVSFSSMVSFLLHSQEFSKYKFRQALQLNTSVAGAWVKGDVYNFPLAVELIYIPWGGVAAQDNSDSKTVFNTKEGFVGFASLILITKTQIE